MKEMGQIILAALVVHLMQILTSCNDTSWINMGFFHRPVTLNLRYHMLIKMIPRFITKQNNHRVHFSSSSKSSVLLYTLFMDSVNALGYKLGSTDITVIPDYYASQASDFICGTSF
jgi:hypothetical protein